MKYILTLILLLCFNLAIADENSDILTKLDGSNVVVRIPGPPDNIIFYCNDDRTVKIDKKDMLSMNEKEIENTILFIAALRNTYISGDVICLWGEKLLPRFFKNDH